MHRKLMLIIALLLSYSFSFCLPGIAITPNFFHASPKGTENLGISASETKLDSLIRSTANITDTLTLINFFYEKGKISEQIGDYQLAQLCYQKCITLSGNSLQNKHFGLSNLGLSNVFFRLGNNSLALEYGYNALTFFEQLADTTQYIHALNAVSQVYLGMFNFVEASQNYDSALHLATKINDSSLIAYLYDHLGTMYHFNGEHTNAIQYYNLAIDINTALKDTLNLCISLTNLSEQYLILENYKKALELLYQAETLTRKIKFNSLLISIHYLKGEAYSKSNLSEKALVEFNKSRQLIIKTGENRELPRLLLSMSQHFYLTQNYQKAYDYLFENKRITDSLQLVDITFQGEEAKLNYEINKKETEIFNLMLAKSTQEEELKTKRNLINLQYGLIVLIAIGFIASMIFTFYFFYSQRKLKLANRTKDLLFSIIGHDLRGPIGNIKQLIEQLDYAPKEKHLTYVKMLKQPVESAFVLLDDLLIWARQTNHQIEYTRKPFLISTLVDQNFALVETQATNKGIKLINELPSNLEVNADSNHMSTVFRNLITNAIKFSNTAGTVTVSYDYAKTHHRFLISDTGIGISPENIKRILSDDEFFTTFGTNHEKGSGIGLAICKSFIQTNGGTLSIESQLGQGSTFFFTLPITQG